MLFHPSDKLWLFYKAGKDGHVWKTPLITSSDRGFHLEYASPLVNDDILPRGPVRETPAGIKWRPRLRRGRLKVLNGGGHL